MNPIYIIGAGGLGRETLWIIERINHLKPTWGVFGYIDDYVTTGTYIKQVPVVGGIDYLNGLTENAFVVCAVGSGKVRKNIIDRIYNDHILFPNIIDPSVIMSMSVNLGKGNIIGAGSILTVDISIGDFILINLSCTIGHDTTIKSFTTLYPNANISGNVLIEECVEIGMGAKVIQNKVINSGSIIGAGSVVINDIPKKCTAVGIPARPIKFHD